MGVVQRVAAPPPLPEDIAAFAESGQEFRSLITALAYAVLQDRWVGGLCLSRVPLSWQYMVIDPLEQVTAC